MKKTLVLFAAVGLVAVGCDRRDSSMNESAGAEQQIEQQKEAQVDQLEQRQEQIEKQTEQRQDQIGEQAEAKQEALRAEAEAQKAQLEAQQEKVQAEAKAQKAQLEAQDVQQEAAGAAVGSDRQIEAQVRQALFGSDQQPQPTGAGQNITVSAKDGKVTLTGMVQSEQQKQDMEQKAKTVQGVKEVENNLRVQNQ